MTLIVALRCRDGVVIASDSQATFSQFISQPAKLPTQKLYPLGKCAVWGSAGDIGLQQKIGDALKDRPAGIWENDIKEIRTNFRDVVIPVMKKAIEDYVPATQNLSPATAHLLVAGHTRDRSWILEVDPNGKDTLHDEFGFCAVGSGSIFAHHALADIRHHSVHEQATFYGQVLAHRVVNGAIECAAFGLGGPVQMWTVTAKGAQQLDDAALKEVADSVSLWNELEIETLSGLLSPTKPSSG